MTWVTNEQPFGVNHAPLLSGLASDGSGAEVPVAVDKDTGELLVSSGGGGGGTSSTFGATFPTTGTAVGATDGTDMQPLKVDGSDRLLSNVSGDVASGASDSGNPVKVGGYADNSAPAGVTDGQRVNAWLGRNGQQWVALTRDDGTKLGTGDGSSDGVSVNNVSQYTVGYGLVYNGTTWDRISEPTADAVGPTGMISAGLMGFNGSTWIRATLGFYSGDGNGTQTGLTTNTQGLVFNGSSWDRLRGDTTNGMWVNVKTSALPTGAATAAIQTNGSQLVKLFDGSNVIGTTANPVVVNQNVSATIINGQQAVTGTAAALASHAVTQSATIQALSTNAISVFVGASGVTTSTGVELPPGAAVTLPVSNTNVVFVIASTTGASVTYIGV